MAFISGGHLLGLIHNYCDENASVLWVVMVQYMCTLMCLSIGTPKNNEFPICSKWKIHYF